MALVYATGLDWSTVPADHLMTFSGGSIALGAHRYPAQMTGTNYTTNLSAVGNLVTIDPPSGHSTLICGFAHYAPLNTVLGTVTTLIDFMEAATLHLRLKWSTTGTGTEELIVFRSTATELVRSAPIALTVGWHYYEVKATLSDTVGSVVVKYDGVEIINATGLDTRNAGTGAQFNRVVLGSGVSSALANRVLHDDIYIATGNGVGISDFMGDSIIEALVPNGNGTYSQLTGSDGNSVDNYLLVDEIPTTNDADYVGSATDGLKDSYPMGDILGSTVEAVIVRQRGLKTDTNPKGFRRILRTNSTDYTGADIALGASAGWFTEIIEDNPDTAAAWTPAEINALEVGFEVRP